VTLLVTGQVFLFPVNFWFFSLAPLTPNSFSFNENYVIIRNEWGILIDDYYYVHKVKVSDAHAFPLLPFLIVVLGGKKEKDDAGGRSLVCFWQIDCRDLRGKTQSRVVGRFDCVKRERDE